MTNDEYTQLIAFLGAQFTQVDARFRSVDTGLAENRREIERLRENVDQKLDHFRGEVRAEFDEVKTLIRLSYADLDGRVRRLEGE